MKEDGAWGVVKDGEAHQTDTQHEGSTTNRSLLFAVAATSLCKVHWCWTHVQIMFKDSAKTQIFWAQEWHRYFQRRICFCRRALLRHISGDFQETLLDACRQKRVKESIYIKLEQPSLNRGHSLTTIHTCSHLALETHMRASWINNPQVALMTL